MKFEKWIIVFVGVWRLAPRKFFRILEVFLDTFTKRNILNDCSIRVIDCSIKVADCSIRVSESFLASIVQ